MTAVPTSVEGKRLLVLGAGLFQLAGITRAVELGCEVFTADNVPHNPGHLLARRSVGVSTTDVEGVCSAAEQLAVDGIVTFASDVATPAVATAMQRLFGRGHGPAAVGTTTDKARFREFQHRFALPCPRSVRVTDPDAVFDPDSWVWPVIVKPVDSSGSRGVNVANRIDEVSEMLHRALDASRAGVAVVEEFVDGREVGGDLFLVDGQVAAGSVTNKYLRDFVVVGHTLPTSFGPATEHEVIDVVARTCRAVGITDGPVNFDVIVDESGERDPIVLELSPRTGGNGIPELIRLSTGFDEYEATIRQALGERVASSAGGQRRRCGSVVFGSSSPGVLTRLDVRAGLGPERTIAATWLRHRLGDHVQAFVEAGASIGYTVFECAAESDYVDALSRMGSSQVVQVRAAAGDADVEQGWGEVGS